MDTFYFDIDKSGKDLTGNKDIAVFTNNQAILESLKNLLLTEPGQHIMQSDFGVGLNEFLFEQIDPGTATLMEMRIERGVEKFESRIKNLVIVVDPDEDNNTYIINLYFTTLYSSKEQKLTLSLKQIR
jgi:phage baseplate assembly protein W